MATKILYAFDEKECHDHLIKFIDNKYIAVDVEGTASGRIQLIQIGNAKTALLIPIWKYKGIPLLLNLILSSRVTVKLFWGDDDPKYFSELGIKICSAIDVQQMANARGFERSLGCASDQILTSDLEVYRKKKNFNHARFRSWDRDDLPSLACKYAASDVSSLFHIFEQLSSSLSKPVVLPPSQLIDAILKDKFKSTYSAYKLAISKGTHLNEIATLVYFTRFVISLASGYMPFLGIKVSQTYVDYQSIESVSECLDFLVNTKLVVVKEQVPQCLHLNGHPNILGKRYKREVMRVKLLQLPITLKEDFFVGVVEIEPVELLIEKSDDRPKRSSRQ